MLLTSNRMGSSLNCQNRPCRYATRAISANFNPSSYTVARHTKIVKTRLQECGIKHRHAMRPQQKQLKITLTLTLDCIASSRFGARTTPKHTPQSNLSKQILISIYPLAEKAKL